jgi:1-deoxy-D-xylulose-5-phosphate reductoisomerase
MQFAISKEMKRIAILGSTGSIGKSTLEVIRNFPGGFQVVGLSANSNSDILYQQIKEFRPLFVCINDTKAASKLKSKSSLKGLKLFVGDEGLRAMLRDRRIDRVVLAISGSSALLPLLAAIENGKDVALANKEALVMAGPIIMERAKKKNIKIFPVDSEQSAIWQCLDGKDRAKLRKIYLTASGGPFRQTPNKDLGNISVRQVLRHPCWMMGRKITVDSATLMNKGLEILEAMFLFDVPVEKIKVLIHPEAIIHSMVEFIDGVILAQLSITDMRVPIQYAISYPERMPNKLKVVDFCKLREFHFENPDLRRFPCLRLAYRVAQDMGTAPCVLNAANEVAVEGFLNRTIDFVSMPKIIEKVLSRHRNKVNPGLEDILQADGWARSEALRVIDNM